MDNEQFAVLTNKIDLLTNALLYNIIKDLLFKDQVLTLNRLGLTEVGIATLLNSNKNSVHTILWRQKHGT